ncbi:7SK snRNA methylphosphate capping enzyme-like [Ornithodoros turicata]|uniref:RNA methyltransferase n=1 Tax=Ornithodoros turicata TaxID=34597 RepID=A0A2R5LLX0_9ACAR
METAVEVPSIHESVSPKGDSFQGATCRSVSSDRPKTLKPANGAKTSPLAKKLLQKEESASSQNRPPANKMLHGKRRQSFGTASEFKYSFKRRRREHFTPPTKFLLGGNINDPLNLASFADAEINKRANEVTPKSSPIPIPKHRRQVEVIIPPNINDPLNLNSGEDIEFPVVSPRNKKRRRRHKRKSKSEDDDPGAQSAPEMSTVDDEVPAQRKLSTPTKLALPAVRPDEKVVDKIVSPVVPQGSPTKFPRRHNSKSGTREPTRNQRRFSTSKAKPVHFREKDAQFQYGNYNRYYGYRNGGGQEDPRLFVMEESWFRDKDVLDIGCNVGHFTLSLARKFSPRKVIGLDIDGRLIKAARKNVRHYLTAELSGGMEFPVSMAICHGPIAAAALPGRRESITFPNNVFFVQGNYILENELLLETQRPEFDTILCLSLTKWVHLNWGDEGIKCLFKRMFLQLRPGGHMILEAQPFHSYTKKKKMTETTYRNFSAIRLRPEKFMDYLLSPEVGFESCRLIDIPSHSSKGFQRPIYLFTKASCESTEPTFGGDSAMTVE